MAEFESAEAAMGEAYEGAREVLWPEAFDRLRLGQRDWLAARDLSAEAYARLQAGPDVADVRATSAF